MTMAEKVRAITESTLLPLSLVVMLSGGIMWLTTIHNKTQDLEKSMDRIEIKQDQYNNSLSEVLRKLSRIEGKLGIQ